MAAAAKFDSKISFYLFITVLILLPTSVSYKYDVFLSYESETNYGFANNLYEGLCLAGIRTFKKEKEIKAGETILTAIEKAINESRISIILFSENYAYSTLCLDELAMGVKLISFGHSVVPVFYHMDPSKIEDEKWNYAVDIANHEKRYRQIVERWKAYHKETAEYRDMVPSSYFGEQKDTYDKTAVPGIEKWFEDRVEGWKAALRKVPLNRGVVVTKDRYESDFIQDIVQLIDDIPKPTVPNVVARSSWSGFGFIMLITSLLCSISFLGFLFGNSRAIESRENDVYVSFAHSDSTMFVTLLYGMLTHLRIQFFRESMLPKNIGRAIGLIRTKAIKESRIAIVVLSGRYAFSKWCLEELVTIMRRRQDEGLIVLPIYHNVKQSDVMHQSGTYGEALTVHERELGMDRVIGYRKALTEAAHLERMILRRGNEEACIQRIMEVIIEELGCSWFRFLFIKLIKPIFSCFRFLFIKLRKLSRFLYKWVYNRIRS